MKFGYIFALLFILSCYEEPPIPEGRVVNAKVIRQSGMGTQENLRFQISTQALTGFSEFKSLTGPRLQVREGGRFLSVIQSDGSRIFSEGFVDDASPQLDYTLDNQTVLPLSYKTLSLLTLWYQYQDLFNTLESVTGFSYEQLFANRSFKVLYEPSEASLDAGGQIENTIFSKLNAAYFPGKDTFIIYRRSSALNLPLAANPQVVSHEFGHAIFEYLWLPSRDSGWDSSTLDYYDAHVGLCQTMMQTFVISGLNEGFADFFSYLYTGSSNILSSSFDPNLPFASKRYFRKSDKSLAQLHSWCPSEDFYCLGTLFAKGLSHSLENYIQTQPGDNSDKRRDFASAIFRSLQWDVAGRSGLCPYLLKAKVFELKDEDSFPKLFGKSIIPEYKPGVKFSSPATPRVSTRLKCGSLFYENSSLQPKLLGTFILNNSEGDALAKFLTEKQKTSTTEAKKSLSTAELASYCSAVEKISEASPSLCTPLFLTALHQRIGSHLSESSGDKFEVMDESLHKGFAKVFANYPEINSDGKIAYLVPGFRLYDVVSNIEWDFAECQ